MKKTSIDSWLEEYESSHLNSTNRLIHKFCVPSITFSILGILHSLPTIFHPLFHWSYLFILGCSLFYFNLSLRLSLIMLCFILPMITIINFMSLYSNNFLFFTSITIFIVSWIFQLIGHRIEGKKPSFFKDLQFLLIGPVWTIYTVLWGKNTRVFR